MGFFSKLFSVESCPFCGSTDLKKIWETSCFSIYACRKCGYASVHHRAPLCACCEKPQKGTARNEYDVIVPKCQYCGHIWDADEHGWVNLD